MPYAPLSAIKHTQSIPLATWEIIHRAGKNRGKNIPVVDVYLNVDGQDTKSIPKSLEILSDRIILTFSKPFTGYALITL